MNHIELYFTIRPYSEDIKDALIYELASTGFEGFCDSADGFKAYIPEDLYEKKEIEKMEFLRFFSETYDIKWKEKSIAPKDWNAEWEKNFSPVCIDDKIVIRAHFHPRNKNIPYDIVIEPKMSFGTGHHPTTVLMLRNILSYEYGFRESRVLDMGCGTGILSIMASKAGAKEVAGIDIDEWAFRNAGENLAANRIDNVKILIGDARLLTNLPPFDIIMANINRNILIRDMAAYAKAMIWGSLIFCSGFYETEIPMIKAEAEANNLSMISSTIEKEWAAAVFRKITD